MVNFISKNMGKQHKINLRVFLFLCLLITSCQSFFSLSEESDYKEIFLFGKEVKETYNLRLVGFGGGFDKGVETFNLTFMGNQTPDLNQARVIFYDIANKFLERINSNEKLLKSSLGQSFSIANLDINIILPDLENYVTGVGNGTILDRDPLQLVYFFTYDSELKKSKITYEEPYEELKSIVEHQRSLGEFY